jgi:adenylate cyclase
MTSSRKGDRAIDFEAEGLLDGLEGEAREARRELLERLEADGVPLEELRAAVAAGRLTLLPVERAFGGAGSEHTPREVAEQAGVELELLERAAAALGIPYPDPDERSLTEADLEAARRMGMLRDAGLPEEGILQVARTIGRAMARIAEANRELSVRTLMQPGDTERDLALRFAAAAEHMQPLVEPVLVYALRAHMLEQIRRDVIGAADLESGEMGATTEVCVCFADLVGFTRLGEEIDPEQLGAVAGRLEEMATGVVEPPVRLVKVIGDAVMIVSAEAEPLIDVALRLVERAEAQGEDFPRLRAGLAYGRALVRAGDFYGRPVNLASRITAIAKPGSVLVDSSVQRAAPGACDYSFAGERHLKGFDSHFRLYRVRRHGAGPPEDRAEAPGEGDVRPRRQRRRGAGRRRR